MKFRWPQGRYNGQKIAGFRISFGMNLFWWHWIPRASGNFGCPYLFWLCFVLRAEPVYHH